MASHPPYPHPSALSFTYHSILNRSVIMHHFFFLIILLKPQKTGNRSTDKRSNTVTSLTRVCDWLCTIELKRRSLPLAIRCSHHCPSGSGRSTCLPFPLIYLCMPLRCLAWPTWKQSNSWCSNVLLEHLLTPFDKKLSKQRLKIAHPPTYTKHNCQSPDKKLGNATSSNKLLNP